MIYRTLVAESEKELKSKIMSYMREFPPEGYGTVITREYESNGQHYADVSRFDSCD